MPTPPDNQAGLGRRALLTSATAMLATPALRRAQAAEPIDYATWQAAVDDVKAHIAKFEAASGISVAYTNSPFARYRETMITKFCSGAPVHLLWVSDAWLPEFAEAGWLAPIDGFPNLMKYLPQGDDRHGAGELADRVHVRDGLFTWRQIRR